MPSISPAEVQSRIGTIQGFLPRVGVPNTLSVCMIVKNEEANIERAITSFLPFADEIIVNDTGSTDRTLEILARLPKVKVIHSEWKRDFSYSRNISLAAATCSWCLWMDADDVVPPEQVKDFLRLKTAPLDRAFGFQIINTQGGGQAVGARFMQIRMFPNHPEIRFERRIHEQIVYSLAKLRLHIFYLETAVLHMGYEQESQRKAKSERNLELILTEPDRGVDPVISTQLGDAYMILERYPEAIDAYKEVLSIPQAEKINPDAYNEVFITIGKCYQSIGKHLEALEWLEQAENRNPGKIDPVFHRAETLFRMQRYMDARRGFEQALTLEKKHSSQASHWDVMRMYSYKFLCDIGTHFKEFPQVLDWSEKFHAEYPAVVEAMMYHGKALLSLGQAQTATLWLEKAVTANPTANRDAWLALMMAYEKLGKPLQVDEVRRRMSQAFGESVPRTDAPNLSIVLIVKNEESHLGPCLASIRGLHDELIVVDTGSTDNTVEIAKSFGAKVSYFPWIGDFSAARNKSLDEAKGRWILWLDADDIVLPEDAQRIRSLVQNPPAQRAYGFMIKNSQDLGITGPVFNQIRLFPNLPEIRFSGRVHEQVSPALQQLGFTMEFLDIRVVHTGYTDPDTIQQKQRRNLDLMHADLAANPAQANAMKFFALANAYMDLCDFDNAEKYYHQSMDMAQQLGEDRHILDILPVKLAECVGNKGNKAEALAMMEQYVLLHPQQPNGIFLRAQLHESLGNMPKAIRDFGYLMHFQEQPTLMPVDYQQIRVKACKVASAYWMEKGRRELAVNLLKIGIAIGKGENVSGLSYAMLYFEEDLLQECRENLQFAQKLDDSAALWLLLGKCHILLNEVKEALATLEAGAKKFPMDSELVGLYRDLRDDLGLG